MTRFLLSNSGAQRQFAVFLTVLLLVSYALSWHRMHLREADFSALYSAARLYQQGSPVYDLQAQCEIQRKVGGSLCLPFSHSPILVPLLSVVVNDNYEASYWRWVSLLLFVLILCSIVLNRITGEWAKPFCLIGLLFVYQSLLHGQDAVFVLLGVALWVLFLGRERDFLAGCCLALTCVKPHIALALAIPLALSRPKALLGFGVAGLSMVLFSLALVGVEGMRGMVQLAMLLGAGKGYGVNQHMMPNAVGLFARAGLPTIWAWVLFPVGMVVSGVLWRLRGINPTTLSLSICIALFTAPHIHLADLSLLTIAAIPFSIVTVPLVSLGLIMGQALYYPIVATLLIVLFGIALCRRLAPVSGEAGNAPILVGRVLNTELSDSATTET